MAKLTELLTLADAKAFLRSRADAGTKCPCCNQFVKIYRRKLNSGMARAMIIAYKIEGKKNGDWFHAVREFSKLQENASTLEFSKLKYWRLVEQKPNEKDPDKKDSGFWRLTERGRCFVENEAKVQKYIVLFDGRFLGFEDDFVNIEECLGSKFSYKELMK